MSFKKTILSFPCLRFFCKTIKTFGTPMEKTWSLMVTSQNFGTIRMARKDLRQRVTGSENTLWLILVVSGAALLEWERILHGAPWNHILLEYCAASAPSMFPFFLTVGISVLLFFACPNDIAVKTAATITWRSELVTLPRGPTLQWRPWRGLSERNGSCKFPAYYIYWGFWWKHAYPPEGAV